MQTSYYGSPGSGSGTGVNNGPILGDKGRFTTGM